jgi:biotin carboxylase
MKHVVLVGGHDETFMHFQNMPIRFSVLQVTGSIGDHLRTLTNAIHPVEDLKVDTVIDAIRSIHADGPVDYIFSFTENGLLPAALAGRHFGISGMPVNRCELCVDKRSMRAHLASTEFAVASRVCGSYAEVDDFLLANPGGIVVKDPKGAGSENVFAIRDEVQLTHVRRLLPREPFTLLAEEFIEGRELSVETLTLDGRHQVLGVTAKALYRDTLAERQHINTPDVVSPALRQRINDFCVRLLARIDYRNGPCHIELKVTDNGIRLIEINNRVGGPYIGLLVELTTGISMFRETLRFLGDGGEPITEGRHGARYQFAAVHMFYEHVAADVLRTDLSGVEILRLDLAEPSPIPDRPHINDDMTGCVVFAGNDRKKFDNAIGILNENYS